MYGIAIGLAVAIVVFFVSYIVSEEFSTKHGTITPTPRVPKLPAGIGSVTTYHDGRAPRPWPNPPSKTRCTPGRCPASSSCSASLGGES